MPIKICAVGYEPKDPLCILAQSYLERGGRRLGAAIEPVAEAKRKKGQNDTAHRDFEAQKLKVASERCFRVALDAEGKSYSSEAFAAYILQLQNQGHRVAFLIGGPTGLSEPMKKDADALLSLSKMTLPHRLALCFLSEQLYRVSEIWRGGPYHK